MKLKNLSVCFLTLPCLLCVSSCNKKDYPNLKNGDAVEIITDAGSAEATWRSENNDTVTFDRKNNKSITMKKSVIRCVIKK
jgi:hypothetical protein